ncbi:MAG: universal stress protein [Haloarculaceae archaeon]
MAKRVLVPVDGSEHAEHATDVATDLFPDATLILLHVINPAEAGYSAQASIPSFSEEWYESQKENAQSILEDLEARAGDEGVDIEREVEVGKPTRVIVDYAEDEDIDHVVMGSHGRKGVSRVLLGSVAETVVRRSPVPVTVTR